LKPDILFRAEVALGCYDGFDYWRSISIEYLPNADNRTCPCAFRGRVPSPLSSETRRHADVVDCSLHAHQHARRLRPGSARGQQKMELSCAGFRRCLLIPWRSPQAPKSISGPWASQGKDGQRSSQPLQFEDSSSTLAYLQI
jgi:hypothetical protein